MCFLTTTAASNVCVDLHARTLYLCVLDVVGTVDLARNLPARPAPFLAAVAPFQPDLLAGCECVHLNGRDCGNRTASGPAGDQDIPHLFGSFDSVLTSPSRAS